MTSDILNGDEIDALLNAAKSGDTPEAGGLQQDDVEKIVNACKENSDAIAESLNLCIEKQYRVEVGEPVDWAEAGGAEQFAVAGLEVIIGVGETAVVMLVPATLPLPDWYTNPGESEAARLQTLAMEWSMNLLPADREAGEFISSAINDLHEDILGMQPADWAKAIPLQLFEEAEEAVATMWLVAAVTSTPFEVPVAEAPATVAPEPQTAFNTPAQPIPIATPQLSGAMARIVNLPVSINVQLASKKIEMGQLMNISPGALLTFNKSCEDLLELYVNNCLYCRGEAVKIGEKFGLKVNEIGSQPASRESIL